MQRRRLLSFVFVVAACVDPVHDDAVEALGPERRGVRPGPNHRPGQPCLTCHGAAGPAEPEFSVAGTVYLARGVLEPVSAVTVHLEDATGATRDPRSNEVGNFYVGRTDWAPVFPVKVTLRDPRADTANGEKKMETLIRESASCADCHRGADGAADHVPAVYLREKAL
jgi:hypothetical protein